MNTYKKFFFAYLVLILLVSSIPGNAIPKTWFSLGWEDKLYHMIEFSVLGILAYLAYYQELRNPFIYFIAGGFLFGLVDELYQSFIPGRFPNAFDIIADGIGVICGSISTHFLIKKVHD